MPKLWYMNPTQCLIKAHKNNVIRQTDKGLCVPEEQLLVSDLS